MNRLLIGGAGGHGKVIADAALSLHKWETLAFVDDRGEACGKPLGLPVLGTFKDIGKLLFDFPAIAIAIGDSQRRLQLLLHCEEVGFLAPVIEHRTASISPFAEVSAGTVVLAHAVVGVGARVGKGCIVNTGASVDHDCELGDGVHICPGVRLAGNVRVGRRAWIGIGSSVREGVVIGEDVVIGAGSAVVADVPSGTTVMGVPARPRRNS